MWILGCVMLVYALFMGVILAAIININKDPPALADIKNPTTFSIIVAFRNEAENLPALLESFQSLHYSKQAFEIIFVNDHSTDDSVDLVSDFVLSNCNSHLLELDEATTGKKAALQLAIETAKKEYILTTDADCVVAKNWLNSYHAKLSKINYDVLIGPVAIVAKNHFLAMFQYYDLLALQAVGFGLAHLGRPILCNGANFCYRRASFFSVNGFQGNLDQPSGDDVLLLQKFVQAQSKVGLVLQPENLVLTKAVTDAGAFILQRKRWFYKTRYATSTLQKALGGLLLLTNLGLMSFLLFCVLNPSYLTSFLLMLGVKVSMDFLLLFLITKKLNLAFNFVSFVKANLFYPLGIVVFSVFLVKPTIQWKERTYPS